MSLRRESVWQGLTVQPQRICPRKVAHPWTGEAHFRVAPTAQSKSVFRTSARTLVPVNDMNPMAIADSGASHAIQLMNALHDDKSVKQVNLRLAAGEITAVESQREIFAEAGLLQSLLNRLLHVWKGSSPDVLGREPGDVVTMRFLDWTLNWVLSEGGTWLVHSTKLHLRLSPRDV